MFTLTNDESTFLKLIDGYDDDPLIPLLRHNVLNHYRNFLSFMVQFKWDDDFISEYMIRHEELMIIQNPINNIEFEQNDAYLKYAYSSNSLRTMLNTLKENGHFIPKTLTLIYVKVMESSSRFIHIDHITLFKEVLPLVATNELVLRYFSQEKHIHQFGEIRRAINQSLINERNIDSVLEIQRTSSDKISQAKFDENLSDIEDGVLNDTILRFRDKMTLMNKWI